MEKIYLLHKDDLNLLLKKRRTLPSIPSVKCSLWEELQTLSSHWGLVSEGEGDDMREDTTTFCIYSSERCQNAPLSPSSRKNLLTKKEMCEGSFFYFCFLFWCHLSNAVGEIVGLKARTIQSVATCQSVFLETGTCGLFKGEAVRSQHWSGLLLLLLPPHSFLTTVGEKYVK